jgi:hypothetical protein
MGIIVVGMTLMMPNIIFYEAFLSYIGLGIKPPSPTGASSSRSPPNLSVLPLPVRISVPLRERHHALLQPDRGRASRRPGPKAAVLR